MMAREVEALTGRREVKRGREGRESRRILCSPRGRCAVGRDEVEDGMEDEEWAVEDARGWNNLAC